eukprot:48130_1
MYYISILVSIYLLSRHLNGIQSISPTCDDIYVNVSDPNNIFNQTNYSVNDFNGIYKLTNTTHFDRPIYKILDSVNDQAIQYYFGTQWWIINDICGSNILSYASNGFLPPVNNTNVQWMHASIGSILYVSLKCITYSPTNAPTNTPTYSPGESPLYNATHLSYSPTNAPTNAPTDSPSQSPTRCVDYDIRSISNEYGNETITPFNSLDGTAENDVHPNITQDIIQIFNELNSIEP